MSWKSLVTSAPDALYRVNKYRHSVGTAFYGCRAETPMVHGIFVLGTEAHDHDGLPHTLEHLIFMGSKNYPEKGFLDVAASKCLSVGTNAWTAVDHTAYTVTTAGLEGFLKILPVYLDHILRPTLTDAAYLTEVHHINHDGEDAGTVYCEMQSHELEAESRCNDAWREDVFPDVDCGYRSETGGKCENLRISTSNEKVRQYHQNFYSLKNFGLIVIGQFDDKLIMNEIDKYLLDYLKDETILNLPFVKPWQSSIMMMKESTKQTVLYSSENEDKGYLYFVYTGDDSSNLRENEIQMFLLKYLFESTTSPIYQAFIENENPICDTMDVEECPYSKSIFEVKISNINFNELDDFREKILKIIEDICVHQTIEFDINHMRNILKMSISGEREEMEAMPENSYTAVCIKDFLYGEEMTIHNKENKFNFEQLLNSLEITRGLIEENGEFWVEKMKTYFSSSAIFATIIGKPSKNFKNEMNELEKQRIVSRKNDLGSAGLGLCGDKLEDALKTNDEKYTMPIMTRTDAGLIDNYIKCRQLPKEDSLPMFDAVNLLNTSFGTFSLIVNWKEAKLSADEMMILPLFIRCLFESSLKMPNKTTYNELMELLPSSEMRSNNHIISDVQLSKIIRKIILDHGCSIGLNGSNQSISLFSSHIFPSVLHFWVKGDERFPILLKLFFSILMYTHFTGERIKTLIQQTRASINEYRNQAVRSFIATTVKNYIYSPYTLNWINCPMRQDEFFNHLLTDKLAFEDIPVKLEELKLKLLNSNLFHMECSCNPSNYEKLKNHSKFNEMLREWKEKFDKPSDKSSFFNNVNYAKQWLRMTKCKEEVQNLPTQLNLFPNDRLHNHHPSFNTIGVSMNSTNSSYMFIAFATDIDLFQHPNLPKLLTTMSYLSQLEGPYWRSVRGKGLAYHVSLHHNPETSLVSLRIYQSAKLVNAYLECVLSTLKCLVNTPQAEKLFGVGELNKLLEKVGERLEDIPSDENPSDFGSDTSSEIDNETEIGFSEDLLQSAKGSVQYELIHEEESVAKVVDKMEMGILKKIPHNYNRTLIRAVDQVTKEEVIDTIIDYILPLFIPSNVDVKSSNAVHQLLLKLQSRKMETKRIFLCNAREMEKMKNDFAVHGIIPEKIINDIDDPELKKW
ncbi:hypothetical protein SNEBB_002389 [Seison nebaliae]|nr:hypothetical protein SNEBB_002389 [Seison nebaliae]